MNREASSPSAPQVNDEISEDSRVNELLQALHKVVTKPPLRDHELELTLFNDNQIKRPKRKSKFTKEQDDMIIDLKKKGKSWMDIAKMTNVGSFLTARNRYQVLMGQQGVASTVWNPDDILSLQRLVDEGELEKWRFISRELYKLTGKFFTDIQCRDLVRELFVQSPEGFGVNKDAVKEIISEQQSGEGSVSPS